MIAPEFFFSLVEIILAATLVSAVLRKLKQPNLFAYIIAGILLGPLVIGTLDLTWLNLPFSLGIKEITPEIRLLSDLGAAFLLFSIGIETSVGILLKTGKPLILGTILQVIGVIGVTILLTSFTGLIPIETAIFVGAILAFSSTMIVIKLLADSKETNTLNGRIIISMLLIQDFLVILLVPLLQNFSQITTPSFFLGIFLKIGSLLLIALIANKIIFPRLFKIAAKENELFFLSSISTALLFIGVSFLLEIPISVGAFIGGLALSNLPYNTAIFSKIRALRDFFLTIFFVSLGAELSFQFGTLPWILIAIILLILFILKPLIFFVVGLFSGYGSRLSLETGFTLTQASEFGFILATLGLSAKIISPDLFAFLITIIAFSMIMTPHLMNYSPRVSNHITLLLNKMFKISEIKLFNKKIEELRNIPQKEKLRNHLIIVGGGLMGRTLAKKLKITNKVLIVDADPEVVSQGKEDKLPFIYGTSEDEELLEQLDLEDTKLVIISMLNHKEGINFVKAIKKVEPKTTIFAASSHYYDSMDYYANGVDYVSIVNILGIEDLLHKINGFKSKENIFINTNAKKAHLAYTEEQAKEEQKYKKRLIV
ncbi:MAG: cation:proton antiporter, partial [archaeon]|jgi:CPA2 family monovalent cation:H+ antiporter-2